MFFDSISAPQSKKSVLEISLSLSLSLCMCVCVCLSVCLSVCASPNIEPKPIDTCCPLANIPLTFVGLQYTRSPKIWDDRLSRKNPQIGIFFLHFLPSSNLGPKPDYESRSNSIYRILFQTYLARIFYLLLKLRVVHIRKKIKMSIFSKMTSNNLIKFSGFIVLYIQNITMCHYRLFPVKSLKVKKIVYNFLSVASPTFDSTSCSMLIKFDIWSPLANISSQFFFRFRSTIKIKGSSHKKKN